MLDTNIFDLLLDNNVNIQGLQKIGEYYTTNVQFSELSNISYQKRRSELLNLYNSLDQIKILLRTGIWLDKLRWDDDQIWIDDIQPEAQSLLGKASVKQPWMDALIGEIAMVEKICVVTNDKDFAKRCSANSIATMDGSEFLKLVDNVK